MGRSDCRWMGRSGRRRMGRCGRPRERGRGPNRCGPSRRAPNGKTAGRDRCGWSPRGLTCWGRNSRAWAWTAWSIPHRRRRWAGSSPRWRVGRTALSRGRLRAGGRSRWTCEPGSRIRTGRAGVRTGRHSGPPSPPPTGSNGRPPPPKPSPPPCRGGAGRRRPPPGWLPPRRHH